MIQFTKFEIGQRVILDNGYANSSEVIVISQTSPNRLFTTIEDPVTHAQWQTMTNRLTEIEKR